ncbi:MAG: hypothetical protein AVDCRST_MAG49-305, partial [uncultured Thermomicrobiales bacterium]
AWFGGSAHPVAWLPHVGSPRGTDRRARGRCHLPRCVRRPRRCRGHAGRAGGYCQPLPASGAPPDPHPGPWRCPDGADSCGPWADRWGPRAGRLCPPVRPPTPRLGRGAVQHWADRALHDGGGAHLGGDPRCRLARPMGRAPGSGRCDRPRRRGDARRQLYPRLSRRGTPGWGKPDPRLAPEPPLGGGYRGDAVCRWRGGRPAGRRAPLGTADRLPADSRPPPGDAAGGPAAGRHAGRARPDGGAARGARPLHRGPLPPRRRHREGGGRSARSDGGGGRSRGERWPRPRHRQGGPGPVDPYQVGTPRRRRDGPDAPPPGAWGRRRLPLRQLRGRPSVGPPPPRAVGRCRLPGWPKRGRDSARRTDPGRGRRLRRDDERPTLPAGDDTRGGGAGPRRGRRHAVGPAGRHRDARAPRGEHGPGDPTGPRGPFPEARPRVGRRSGRPDRPRGVGQAGPDAPL